MPMYNLTEYSEVYSKTSESVWQYRDEQAQDINCLMTFSHFNGSSYFKNWLMTLTFSMAFCQFSVSCFIDARCKLVL